MFGGSEKMANKSIDECKDLKTLFELWKNKSPKNINGFEINHKDNVFISDGIVNPQIWFDQKPRILFVLKEAYSNKNDGDWLLTDWIASGECLHYKIWRRIAIWTYGVLHTTRHSICPYKEQYPEAVYKDILQRIASLNIKKSNGKSKSDYDELEAYAFEDMPEIKKEFMLIDPDVVICGNCFHILNSTVFGLDYDYGKNDNWYYYKDTLGKKRLFLDFYHPGNHWPDLLNYYGLMGIYQQALICES